MGWWRREGGRVAVVGKEGSKEREGRDQGSQDRENGGEKERERKRKRERKREKGEQVTST